MIRCQGCISVRRAVAEADRHFPLKPSVEVPEWQRVKSKIHFFPLHYIWDPFEAETRGKQTHKPWRNEVVNARNNMMSSSMANEHTSHVLLDFFLCRRAMGELVPFNTSHKPWQSTSE